MLESISNVEVFNTINTYLFNETTLKISIHILITQIQFNTSVN